MERIIKFRGKRLDNEEWIYGGISVFDGEVTMFDENSIDNGAYDVDPATVGQFTGLTDKNGKEIWEGNILEFTGGTTDFLRCGTYASDVHKRGTILIVKWFPCGFMLVLPRQINIRGCSVAGHVQQYDFWNHQRSLVIIGNVHDNPELISNTEKNKQ